MTDSNPEDLRNLDSVKQFVAAAEHYCTLLENHEDYPIYEFLREVAIALTSLHLAALNLSEPELDEDEEDVSRHNQPYEPRDFSRLRARLGQHDVYHLVFDPYNKHGKDAITFRVTTDLAEIYGDINKYLRIYREGTPAHVREVVWQWHFSFEIHWGRHVVDVLKPIQWLISDSSLGFKPKDVVDWDDDLEEGD